MWSTKVLKWYLFLLYILQSTFYVRLRKYPWVYYQGLFMFIRFPRLFNLCINVYICLLVFLSSNKWNKRLSQWFCVYEQRGLPVNASGLWSYDFRSGSNQARIAGCFHKTLVISKLNKLKPPTFFLIDARQIMTDIFITDLNPDFANMFSLLPDREKIILSSL